MMCQKMNSTRVLVAGKKQREEPAGVDCSVPVLDFEIPFSPLAPSLPAFLSCANVLPLAGVIAHALWPLGLFKRRIPILVCVRVRAHGRRWNSKEVRTNSRSGTAMGQRSREV